LQFTNLFISTGNEIDVIYNIAQHILPIEIKAGETVASDFLKGFLALEKVVEQYPYGRIVVYGGTREETRHDILITNVPGVLDRLREI
jgi:hypothetical protein